MLQFLFEIQFLKKAIDVQMFSFPNFITLRRKAEEKV